MEVDNQLFVDRDRKKPHSGSLTKGKWDQILTKGEISMKNNSRKIISKRALEMWSSNNSERAEDFYAENYINHQEPDPEGGISDKNLATWKELLSGFHKAFPNSRMRVLMQIADEDLVATRWEIKAIQTGEYMGKKPTGKELIWTGVATDRFEGNKIVETWVNWDKYRLFEELGLVK
jgi:predicted ester cyclase